jgi:hypothetical protein
MVNGEFFGQKPAETSQKAYKTGQIPASKTTVNYNRRFFVNGRTVRFAVGSWPALQKILRFINDMA